MAGSFEFARLAKSKAAASRRTPKPGGVRKLEKEFERGGNCQNPRKIQEGGAEDERRAEEFFGCRGPAPKFAASVMVDHDRAQHATHSRERQTPCHKLLQAEE